MHFVKARGILSASGGMNLYRGCLHGCIYCDSRSKCYNMNHDFEDIEVKENALELLDKALRGKRKKCMIGMGSMTDPYIPLEKGLEYTRSALEIIRKNGFGATLITKSKLVLRDLDILKKINEETKCIIQMTLTAADEEISKKIEPRVCTTAERFEVLKILRDENIPTVVWLSPILPFITDTRENVEEILKMCKEAKVKGVICFDMGVTLREGNREYFYSCLDKIYPRLRKKYEDLYGDSYILSSPKNSHLMALFHKRCEKYGIMHNKDEIFSYLKRYETKYSGDQIEFEW